MPVPICLVTMLKNESENVLNMLKSVENLWDFCVCGFDNTSDDGTEEIVREYLNGHKVFYHHYTWRNDFSWARNLGLDLALGNFPQVSYALMMDGDDILHPISRPFILGWKDDPHPGYSVLNAYIYLDYDAFGIPMLFYPRCHLFKNDPRIRFKFKSHNVIESDGDEQLLVRDFIILHRQAKHKRAYREKQRIEMNIANLQEQAEGHDEPARPLFYEGNTRMDAGDYEGAEHAFTRYLERATWHEERYQAMHHLSSLRMIAGDSAGARTWAWRALQEPGQWNRAESYVMLGDLALFEGRPGEALHWLEIAGSMPPPVNSLFLQGPIYTWFPHWRLTLLYDRLGRWGQALEHARIAARWRPSPDILRAVEVLEACIQEWGPGGQLEDGLQRIDGALPLATGLRPITDEDLAKALERIGTNGDLSDDDAGASAGPDVAEGEAG